jgi:hypothetical protein
LLNSADHVFGELGHGGRRCVEKMVIGRLVLVSLMVAETS